VRRLRALATAVTMLAVTLTGPLTHSPDEHTRPSATTWSADRAAGTATLVVVGDSIPAGGPYCGWPNCWPGRAAWEWPTTNLARSGAMPGDLIPGGWCYRVCWYDEWGAGVLAQIGQLQPSGVLVELGTVPYGWLGQHPTDYLASMRALVEGIRAVSPRSTILLVHGPGFVASHGLLWILVDYGAGLDAYAASLPNAAFFDFARVGPWSNTDTAGVFASDRVHLSNAGHVVLAVGVVTWLRGL